MWAFALCLLIRGLFVSLIARYQLCNVRGESVLDGLCRLHPIVAPSLFFVTLILSHAIGVFLYAGAGQACANLSGGVPEWIWSLILAALALLIVFRPAFSAIEKVFFALAALLTVTLVGLAVLSLPSPSGIARGLFAFALPEDNGLYSPSLVVAALVGAVGGGLGNLTYTSFAREKGWVTPAHRKVQQYDLFFGLFVLIVLDLSVWVLGAETLYGKGQRVSDVTSLASIVGSRLGDAGFYLFYLGLLGAIFGAMVGNAYAYSSLAAEAFANWRNSVETPKRMPRDTPQFRWLVLWVTISPLFWVFQGRGDFVGLTLLVNSAQVLLIPLLVVGMWILTSRESFIGAKYRNTGLDHAFTVFLLLMSCASAWFSVEAMAAMSAGSKR
jgi:Mn2+/Fe2+ NRAMP family transporter